MNTSLARKESIYWIDLTRVLAIFLVVMIHVMENIVNRWNEYPADIQNIANFYNSLTRMSVPLFFMSSGWLLLRKSESLRDFFTKRWVKVVFPFAVWSLIYLIWGCGITLAGCKPTFISRLIFIHGTYHHLWFMYPLIGLYLITPLLRLMISPDKKYLLWYFVVLWILFEPIASIADQFFDFRTNFAPPMLTEFIGFFILGYLLGEMNLSKRIFFVSGIVWLISTLFVGISTYFLNLHSEQFDYFFYYFLSLPVVISSISGFILFRWLADHSVIATGWVRSLIKTLAPASFGIYLVHILVLEIIDNRNPFFRINTDIGNPIWSIPVVSLLVFFISFLIVFLMHKIPILKKIVP